MVFLGDHLWTQEGISGTRASILFGDAVLDM